MLARDRYSRGFSRIPKHVGASTLTYSYVNVALHPKKNRAYYQKNPKLQSSGPSLPTQEWHSDEVTKSVYEFPSSVLKLPCWVFGLKIMEFFVTQLKTQPCKNLVPATQSFSSHVPQTAENLC